MAAMVDEKAAVAAVEVTSTAITPPAANPLANPMAHSMDGDVFHFPGGSEWNVFESIYLSKYMFLDLVAIGLVLVIFLLLARNYRSYKRPKGAGANLLEEMLVFIRDQVVHPTIGAHDAPKYLPFLWTLFFFMLFGNLLGLIPGSGSPTSALGTTLALALCTFVIAHGSGIKKMGPGEYFGSLVPHVPAWLYPLMVVIELIGHLIRPIVLAFRLFVNMVAGHTVMFVLGAFILLAQGTWAAIIVTPASVLGSTALMFLEIFVAFLQAFIFVFLSSLYISMALHPHH